MIPTFWVFSPAEKTGVKASGPVRARRPRLAGLQPHLPAEGGKGGRRRFLEIVALVG